MYIDICDRPILLTDTDICPTDIFKVSRAQATPSGSESIHLYQRIDFQNTFMYAGDGID